MLALAPKTEAQLHNAALARRKPCHGAVQCRAFGVLLQPVADLRLVGGKYVHQKQLVAVAVGVQRFVDAGILTAVGTFAQVH